MRSRDYPKTEEYNFGIHCIPLRYVRLLQPTLFSILLLAILPFYSLLKRPHFIITEPGPASLAFVWKPLLSCLKTRLVLDIRSTPVESTGGLASLRALLFRISVVIADRLFDGMTAITEPMKEQVAKQSE